MLVGIYAEEHWLHDKGHIELDHGLDLLGLEVQLEDQVWLREDYCGWLLSFGRVLEVVLHAHFIEYWQVFHNDSGVLSKRIVLMG